VITSIAFIQPVRDPRNWRPLSMARTADGLLIHEVPDGSEFVLSADGCPRRTRVPIFNIADMEEIDDPAPTKPAKRGAKPPEPTEGA
jgi:hypothetical protein